MSFGRSALPMNAASHEPDNVPVVGIGASAGGLDVLSKLLAGMPADNGMAFVVIQHLDPTHPSLMVELLAGHTAMTVRQAADGMALDRDSVYVIPPGVYLSIHDGTLRVSEPQERHGARLPFDFLLRSLADDCGERAICVVLSGTGADGSVGLKAVKEKCGLVIAQAPEEAGFDGMPRSAIATGAVDLVLPVAEIPEALVKYARRMALTRPRTGSHPHEGAQGWLPEIIELLRSRTDHDFTHYKPGTLRRRIERRMAMASIETDDMERYLELLRGDARELDVLAKDLLINVTSFFRDPNVFELLAEKTAPDLIRHRAADQSIRIWVAGCSTGEEAYSLAMLFREQIAAAGHNIKLQVFASDADPDAVAAAREGLYPEIIEADVSPERLARFFVREDHGYRVIPELRTAVVFTVQDVLSDPPFAHLDLISCRNLLIYLQPEAQAKVVALFHFALREGGILLLGSAETVGSVEGRFEAIAKAERLYRRIGRARPGEFGFLMNAGEGARGPARPGLGQAPSRQAALADLCRRLVADSYAPAAVLVSRGHECLYSMGPTDRYLRVVPGHPSQDVLAMARDDVRIKLRSAIQQAVQTNAPVVVGGGQLKGDGDAVGFSVAVRPVQNDGENLLLVCFLEEPKREQRRHRPDATQDVTLVEELERELAATKAELQGAIRDLEISAEEQKAFHEEALSVNEEFQATNEELLTSKEELQSLNEELTALNSQLQETLDRQRTTANDLENVLYSTDVATLFLDTELKIRFFTPATKSLFNVISSDVGRPLADLSSLAADSGLLADSRTVLETHTPMEREVEAHSGAWYVRRILPYRAKDKGVAGVVITFTDITERRKAEAALEAAMQKAEQANLAKSRFLSVASHDLRQPLQTLALLQGLLARAVDGEKARNLVARLDETLAATSGMLNALLDINRIESGTIHPEKGDFPINDLLGRLVDEFSYHTQARGLELRAVPCGLWVHSDPPLLEQMIRNLLSNALKYTRSGKVLLGCRRRGGSLSIEVWDTGIGIPDHALKAIFEEYHQLDNAAHERSRGLGLGLSIVQRLGNLLGHRVSVRSRLGRGSAFAIEVMFPPGGKLQPERTADHDDSAERAYRTGMVLVVEDEPEVRDLLEATLKEDGHRTAVATDGLAALDLVAREAIQPDLILADYNLPNGMNGLEVAASLRENLHREIPVIVLTGDISTATMRTIAEHNCIQINKPAKVKELAQAVQRLLPEPHARHPTEATHGPTAPVVYVVDDDAQVREAIRGVLEEDERVVEDFATSEAFLEAYQPGREGCLLIDAYLPGMSGLDLLRKLNQAGRRLPSIMITGSSDVAMAVQAMKAGALDFIEKPVGRNELLDSVERALELSRDATKLSAWREDAAARIAMLSPRQRQIMDLVLAGHPSKNIAADLGIGQRTVENHRAAIMKKTGSKSLPALARLALAAAGTAGD